MTEITELRQIQLQATMEKNAKLLKMFDVCDITTICEVGKIVEGKLNNFIIQVYTMEKLFSCLQMNADGSRKMCCSDCSDNPSIGMLWVYDKIIELTYKYDPSTIRAITSMQDRFRSNFVDSFGPGLRMRGPEFDFICYIKTSVPLDYKALPDERLETCLWRLSGNRDIVPLPDEGLEMCLWCLSGTGDIVPFPDGKICKISALNAKLEIADREVRDLMNVDTLMSDLTL